jgi:hypothetical protein
MVRSEESKKKGIECLKEEEEEEVILYFFAAI